MRRRGLRNVRGRCRAARTGARPRRARATAFEPAPSSFRPQARALAKSVGARQLRCSPYRAAPEAGMSGAADASAPCHGQGGARRKPRSARMRGAVHAWVPLGVERALSGSARTHARRAPFCPATRQAQGGNCVPEWREEGEEADLGKDAGLESLARYIATGSEQQTNGEQLGRALPPAQGPPRPPRGPPQQAISPPSHCAESRAASGRVRRAGTHPTAPRGAPSQPRRQRLQLCCGGLAASLVRRALRVVCARTARRRVT